MPDQARTFSFVHVADLHLDTPFQGVHDVAPEIALALREASLEAFDAVIDLALERRVDFVLIAGDIYDGAERGLRAQLRFRDGLGRLSDAGIASFVVHGNHDPVGEGWSAIASWPAAVTVFPAGRVDVVPIEKDGRLLGTIQGISYEMKATTENLARKFSRPASDGFHIGLLHCNVEGAPSGHLNYSPCTLADLHTTGLDYLALGHVHQRRVLSGHPGSREPFVVYPGNTQARSPRASEREPKGAYVVTVRDGVVEELEFIECDKVRFVDVSTTIAELSDLGELEDRLIEHGREEMQRAGGRGVVLRARVEGAGSLHRDLVRAGTRDDLLQTLRDLSYGSPFCWWDEVLIDTAPPIDLDEIAGRDDFGGDLLGLARAIGGDVQAREVLVAQLIAVAPKAMQRHLHELFASDEQLSHLIDNGTMLAVSELFAEA